MRRLRHIIILPAVFASGVITAAWLNPELSSTSRPSPQLAGQSILAEERTRQPLTQQRNTESFELSLKPRDFGFLLIAAFIVAWLIRRRKRTDIKNYSGKTEGDLAVLDRTAEHMTISPFANAPRALLENPYGADVAAVDFETRVQCAIEMSLRASRVIGVIHLGLAPTGLHMAEGHTLPDTGLARVADALRDKLRSSDHVRISADGKIDVFISLLATRDHLRKIATRLAHAVREIEVESGLSLVHQPGCAIYPRDGYASSELVQAARENALCVQVIPGLDAGWEHVRDTLATSAADSRRTRAHTLN